MPFERYTVFIRDHPRFGPTFQRVRRQPGWVARLALTAALLVVVVPILILVAAALLVAAAVFVVGSLIARVLALFSIGGGSRPVAPRPAGDDGRENVRVIRG
ncbi:MAG: hypothetical protein AAF586_11625 [Planctomycetota bacterium]